MAGDWMKVEHATPDKPEIFEIAQKLDMDPDAVFGKCFRVWAWFDTHTEDGIAPASTALILDRISGASGFCEALCQVGWLKLSDSTLSVVGFEKHTSASAKRRANTALRVQKHRELKKGNADVTPDVTDRKPNIPRPVRRKVIERDKVCVYCGCEPGKGAPPKTDRDNAAAIDHVIPLSRGGANEINNMVLSCNSCNNYKGDRTPDECGLDWPTDQDGKRYGSVTSSVTRALPEKRREEEKEYTSVSADADTDPPAADSKPTPVPWEQIVDIYHETLPMLPRIVKARFKGGQSYKNLRARWREHKHHRSLDFWRQFFEVAKSNPWWIDPDQWGKADLHWFVKRANFDKVIQRWENMA